jgi:hypothetical protein
MCDMSDLTKDCMELCAFGSTYERIAGFFADMPFKVCISDALKTMLEKIVMFCDSLQLKTPL